MATENSVMSLFLKSNDGITKSNVIPLSIFALTSSGILGGIPLFLGGDLANKPSGIMPLFIAGPQSVNLSGVMTLFVEGTGQHLSAGLDLFLYNNLLVSGIPLFIQGGNFAGVVGNDGAVPIYNNKQPQ